MKSIHLLPASILLAACFSSCNFIVKKRLYMPGYYVDWVDLGRNAPRKNEAALSVNVYDALSVKPIQETCIPVDMASTIYLNEGTSINFPSKAFVYENGKTVQCDKVCVYTWEFYTLSDIIASGLSTTSGKRMLVSGGMIYVEVTCCGERLKLRPGKRIEVRMPAGEDPEKMRLFAGKMQNGIVDWKSQGKAILANAALYPPSDSAKYAVEGDWEVDGIPITDGVLEAEYEGEYEGGDPTYLMKSTALGWINCDRFYDIEKKTTLAVTADTSRKTYVAIVFTNIKSVMPGYYNKDNIAEFTGIPKGEDVKVLAYRVDEKKKVAVVGMKDVTLGEEKKVDLDMEEMSLDEFKTLLAGFN